MNPISDPVPVADGTPDPQAPAAATAAVATDAFAAMLAAAALGPPPTPGQGQAARTAPAEGTKAGSDSPGSKETPVAGAASASTATPPAPTPTTGSSQAYVPGTGALGEGDGGDTDADPAAAIPVTTDAPADPAPAARTQGRQAQVDRLESEFAPPAGQPNWMPLGLESGDGADDAPAGPAAAPTQGSSGGDIPISFDRSAASGGTLPDAGAARPPAGGIPISLTGAGASGAKASDAAPAPAPLSGAIPIPDASATAAAAAPDTHVSAPVPQPPSQGAHPVPTAGHNGSSNAKDRPEGGHDDRAEVATPVATGLERGPLADAHRPEVEPIVVRPMTARLHELVDRAQATIRVAVREGHTDARITLRPAELGEVRITLRYGHGGVSALVTADSSKAVELLSQASSDLRRSLEQQGLSVHGLDVRLAGGDARQGAPTWRDANPSAQPRHQGYSEDDDNDQHPQSSDQQARVSEPGRIDVLA